MLQVCDASNWNLTRKKELKWTRNNIWKIAEEFFKPKLKIIQELLKISRKIVNLNKIAIKRKKRLKLNNRRKTNLKSNF